MGMASRRGFLSGLAAYVMWGFFPIYFHDLRPAGAVEILAHRIVWSAVSVAILITVIRRWRTLRDLTRRPRTVAGIALARLFEHTRDPRWKERHRALVAVRRSRLSRPRSGG